MVYLDNAATTRPIVAVDEVNEILKEVGINSSELWLNSHSSYSKGDYLLWVCREKIGEIIGCNGREVLFTSGGCEGNSLLINALYNMLGRPVLVSKNEHRSVLNNPHVIQSDDYEWCMLVNNETGEKYSTYGLLGSDIVQGLGKEKVDVKELLGVSWSGHKIHGGKVGGVVVKLQDNFHIFCKF